MDSLALTSVLDYWKDYDPTSVLLAYGELKRRDYGIPESLSKKQNQFCEKYSAPNIEDFLNTSMKEIGFNSYEEYFYKEFPERALTEAQRKEKEEKKIEEKELKNNSSAINPSNIVSAGKALKSVVSVTLLMIVIAVIGIFIAGSSEDLQTIQNTNAFVGVSILLCNIIILFQLYSAGDNLVKSTE